MTRTPPDKIRARLLKERGLAQHRPEKGKHRRFKPIIEGLTSGKSKTSLMKYLEQKYGEPIEQVLLSGSLSIVARKLGGEVDTSTLSKWIKKLRLRYNEDNLPNCESCSWYRPACDLGICYILIELELWDLLEVKKTQVLEGLEPSPVSHGGI